MDETTSSDAIPVPEGARPFLRGEAVPEGREMDDWLQVWSRALGTPRFVYEDEKLGFVSPMFQEKDRPDFNVGQDGFEYLKEHDGAYLIAQGGEVRLLAAKDAEPMMEAKNNPGQPAYMSLQREETWDAATPIEWPPVAHPIRQWKHQQAESEEQQ